MRTSETIDALAAALAQATCAFGAVVKDAANPHLRTRYASLAASIDATQGPLAAHGLSVVSGVERDGDAMTLRARLVHASGQWVEVDCPVLVTQEGRQPPMQMLGSAITYARRYAVMALLGLAPVDEDDDGEAQRPKRREAPARSVTPHPQEHAAVPATPAKRQASIDELAAFLRSHGLSGADLNAYREAGGKDLIGRGSNAFHLGSVLARLEEGEVERVKAHRDAQVSE